LAAPAAHPLKIPIRLPALWRALVLSATLGVLTGRLLLDSWGLRREVAWDAVQQVQLARWPAMLFMPAIKVVTREGCTRWLPRESRGLDELHALALRAGGPGHPLLRALETPLHRL
jgi:hypothetical protein